MNPCFAIWAMKRWGYDHELVFCRAGQSAQQGLCTGIPQAVQIRSGLLRRQHLPLGRSSGSRAEDHERKRGRQESADDRDPRLQRRHSARCNQIRRIRQCDWQRLYPQGNEERWAASQFHCKNLPGRQSVLDLRQNRISEESGLFARLSACKKSGAVILLSLQADVLAILQTRSADNAVLDHPRSQQPVARRPVVSAVVGILADLRVDESSEPDARRLLHARYVFGGDGAAFLGWVEYLGDRARRWNRCCGDRRSLRAASADPTEDQSIGTSAGYARHVLHHFRCMLDVMGWRLDSRTDAAKLAIAYPGLGFRVPDLSVGAGGMRYWCCDCTVFPAGADAPGCHDPRRRR